MNDLQFPRHYKITKIDFKRSGKPNNTLTMEEVDHFLQEFPPQRKYPGPDSFMSGLFQTSME